MALDMISAGMAVKYCVEATAGTRPTSGYTVIPGVKSIPEFGGEPNTVQTTTLAAEKFHTYTMGLQDPGGSIGLTVNDRTDFRTAWTALKAAFEGLTGNKQVWFEFAYPPASGLESFYFTGIPSDLSFGGAEVDEVLENTAYIVPTGEPVWAAAST